MNVDTQKSMIVLIAITPQVKRFIIDELSDTYDFLAMGSDDYSFLTEIPVIDLLFINADLPEEKVSHIIDQLNCNKKIAEIPKIGISQKNNLNKSILSVKRYFEDYLVIPDALKILKTLIQVWISTFNQVYIANNSKYIYNEHE